MNLKVGRTSYHAGQVVYFHHFHSKKRPDVLSGPSETGEYRVRIEGKPRRMLILGRCYRVQVAGAKVVPCELARNNCQIYEAIAHDGYVVLSLQSKKPPGDKWLSLKGFLDEGKVTFVELHPYVYPAKSVCHGKHQEIQIKDKNEVDYIKRILSFDGLGWDRA